MKILLAAVSVFSMFFGAGNLIYPIFVGVHSLSNFAYGIFGLLLSGVLLLLLGLFSMSLYDGKIDKFFNPIGKLTAAFLIALMLLIMGPLGAIPRCILVSYSGFLLIAPNASVAYFSAAFCIISGILAANKTKMVDLIGKWLTPVLILGVFIIIAAGLFSDGQVLQSSFSVKEVIKASVMEGYYTMDVCAAIFFAKIILDYLKSTIKTGQCAKKAGIASSCIGMAILAIIYGCLIFVSAKNSVLLTDAIKPELLVKLAFGLLGNFGGPIACVTIFMACLTTTIALVELVAEWFSQKLKIDTRLVLFIVCASSFIFSMIGFEDITSLLGYILMIIYPALICLALCNVLSYFMPSIAKFTYLAFWTACIVSFANLYFI